MVQFTQDLGAGGAAVILKSMDACSTRGGGGVACCPLEVDIVSSRVNTVSLSCCQSLGSVLLGGIHQSSHLKHRMNVFESSESRKTREPRLWSGDLEAAYSWQ